ncbi:MAG: beta-glucosidase [Micavibrio sp.]|nr:beta-glucosidase [Micavibrio sp.]
MITVKKRFNAQAIASQKEIVKNLSDFDLLDLVQKQTLRYFWDFGHPVSGMARERSVGNFGYDVENTITTGGTGFGIMAMLAGARRGWIPQRQLIKRLETITGFLEKAEAHHGVFPHFLDGTTGKTVPFGEDDDGGDIVETSFLMAGLLTARQYLRTIPRKDAVNLAARIDTLWCNVEWDWHSPEGANKLLWHWSPNSGYKRNHEINGWNECLITHVMAAASPTHPVSPDIYKDSWSKGREFKNGNIYGSLSLPLGPVKGGPLFFTHYSFMGLDPRGLKDGHADYWQQNLSHVLINRAHCIENPGQYKGYGVNCWGLTASDSTRKYDAHSPTNDHGVITPTAALASFPYTPEYAMQALRHFYEDLGDKIWTDFGFVDAFNESEDWYAKSHLAIDQAPIVAMIENYRSGLLWELFMGCPEIRKGLQKLGFESPYLPKPASPLAAPSAI